MKCGSTRSGRVVLPALIVLSLLPTALSTSPNPALGAELRVTTTTGETLLRLDLRKEPSWCVLWNHSVTGFEVRDCFAYRDGTLLLVSHHTPDFAAGLGPVPGRGRLESDGYGGYVIQDIDEAVPDNAYVLRVGSLQVDHRIEHGGRTVSLSERAAGARAIVSVVEVTSGSKQTMPIVPVRASAE